MSQHQLREQPDGLHGGDAPGFDDLPNLVFILEADGTVAFCNRRSGLLLGIAAEQVVGRDFESLVNPLDRKLLPANLDEVVDWSQREEHPLEAHLRYGEEGKGLWRLFALDARPLDGGRLLMSLHPIGRPASWSVPRQLLLEAVEAADSSITIADCRLEDMPLVYVNQGFRKITGYESEELLGRNCRFLQFDADGKQDENQPGLDEIRRGTAEGAFAHATLRNYRKDGTLFHNDLYLTPVRSRGELVAFIGVQNDVTHRQRSLDAIAQREHAIRSFFDAAPMLMGVLELRGGCGGRDGERRESWERTDAAAWRDARHVMANQAAADFFATDKDGFRDLPLGALRMPEAALDEWAASLAATMSDGTKRTFRCKLDRPASDADGPARRSLRVTVNVVRPGDGEPPRASYIAEDVTEVEANENNRVLLAAAVENSDLSVLITDTGVDEPGPKILYVNPAFTRVTGYEPHEIVGKTPRVLQGPLTDRTVLNRVREALQNEEGFVGETINYRKDGSPYHIRWSIAPIRDGDGKLTHWVASQEDVSHRRKLEREVLDIQQNEQKRIARDLHDSVAQQLNALSLYAQTMRQELGDAAADGGGLSAADAADCREQLGRVVELAAEAAGNARAISHALLPVDLSRNGLMVALQRLASHASEIYGIDCTFDCAEPILLQSHEAATHLHRVAQEALNNAVRHGKAKAVRLVLRAAEFSAADSSGGGSEEATLAIIDDGVGIPSPAPTEGLGLNTMRYRAEIVGGHLDIARGNGKGDRPGTVVSVRFGRDLTQSSDQHEPSRETD